MGDRSNIVLKFSQTHRIFLYSHSTGPRIVGVVHKALNEGRSRWDDPSYFARIVFDRLIGADQGSLTGFGMSPELTDNEYDLLVLDMANLTVEQTTEEGLLVQTWSYEQFAKLDHMQLSHISLKHLTYLPPGRPPEDQK